MKFIIIGLGNFGSHLGIRLIEEGHEVMGVDNSSAHIEMYKDKLTHTICADSSDELVLRRIPLDESDYIIVSIGEDLGASVTTVALLKKLCQTKIIARAISPIHHTILETMEVNQIIEPEAEYADEFSKKFGLKGAVKSLALDNKFEIAEIELPKKLIGKTIQNSQLRNKWGLNVVTVVRKTISKNIFGKTVRGRNVLGVLTPDTTLEEGDILVLFGLYSDLRNFSEHMEASF
ncbi:MAG: TrkA family potassium uptake protein [Bacteroidetes Order II. Incertae sedis bacterium]|nr:TrkA family potassium uptake protein [Bacteroidetes Order II. bacterium]